MLGQEQSLEAYLYTCVREEAKGLGVSQVRDSYGIAFVVFCIGVEAQLGEGVSVAWLFVGEVSKRFKLHETPSATSDAARSLPGSPKQIFELDV